MIKEFTLKGDGLVKEVKISSIGAAIMKMVVAAKDGRDRDIVLGFDRSEDYYNNPAFFGTVVGAIANRTKNGIFKLEGKTYSLPKNEGDNNLHTDFENGLHKKIFDGVQDANRLTLSLELKDMEDGLPGNRELKVIYTLEDDTFGIEYTIVSDKTTVYNPTNHSYFNLNGHDSGSIEGLALKLNADHYTAIDEELIPTGELVPATGGFDYREEKKLMLPEYPLDHNFVRRGGSAEGLAAVLASDESGIGMEITTDLPGIQIYMGGSIPDIKGKDGASYKKFSGIAMETQYFPNCLNERSFACPVVNPDEQKTTVTSYKFFRM